jgi:hypothetical protein
LLDTFIGYPWEGTPSQGHPQVSSIAPSLESENLFAHVLFSAPDTPSLRALAARVRAALPFQVVEPATADSGQHP